MDKLVALVASLKLAWMTLASNDASLIDKAKAVLSFGELLINTFAAFTSGDKKLAFPNTAHVSFAPTPGMTANDYFTAMQASADAGASGQLFAQILAFLQSLPSLLNNVGPLLPLIQQLLNLFKHPAAVDPNAPHVP